METNYPIEWEERAYQETLQGFKDMWGRKRDRFLELLKENESITFEEKNLFNIESYSKELIDLYERLFHQLIFQEPYLYRMLAYISMTTKDRQARQNFFERYLQAVFGVYDEILNIDVLINSDLAQSKELNSIPIHTCFIGNVLKDLLDKVESQWMTDNGNPEHFKVTKTGKGLQFEYFNQADYESPLVSQHVDNILYSMIHKAQTDRRQNMFFGKSFDKPEYKIVKRFGSDEKEIPFQMLPKYAGLIKKESKKMPYEERQEYETEIIIHFLEALLDKRLNKRKPVNMLVVAFFKNQLKWRANEAWERESSMIMGKRIKNSDIEREMGSLDDDIVNKEGETVRRGDFIPDDKAIDPREALINDEILHYALQDKGLVKILENDLKDITRTPADRKYFQRRKEEIRKKFDIKI